VTDQAMDPREPSTNRPSPRGRRWLVALAVVTSVGLVGAASVTLAFQRIYDSATIPSEDELVLPDPTVVLDSAGETLQTLERSAVRRNVALGDLPAHVPAAVLAAEDRRFHEHRGFSVRGIVRAALANLRAGEVVQGASTIHQQYVAMAVADVDDSYVGKFREVATAARLDDEFSKDRILEMYLNSVPFGRNAHGIQAAARTYFDADAVDLSVAQAATLAGMIAAPSAYDPDRNPEGASARRDFVLAGMVEMGTLDPDTAEELRTNELPELRTDPLFSFGPDAYFLDAVRDEVTALLGEDREVSSGLMVHTTLDPRAQDLAHRSLSSRVDGVADSGAVVTIESATGAVRALLGGPDYESQQFNVAVEGRRQIGSSFKTFALAELVDRGYDPDTSEVDAPREYDVGTDDDTTTIGNYSGQGHGEVSVRRATTRSINTAFVILSEALGHDRVADMATRLGLRQEVAPHPSTVLGTTDLTPLEVTAAYATLGAQGVRNDPYLIERIETHEGEVVYQHEPEPVEVLSVDSAAVITDVLVDVVESGTGTAAALDRPVAGKTGTTNDFRDAWFVGYTAQLTTSVWVGNQDNSPMDGVAGGSVPAATWAAYMGALLEDVPVEGFPAPDTSGLEPFEDLDATSAEEDEVERPTPGPEAEPSPGPELEPREDDATEDEDTGDDGDAGGDATEDEDTDDATEDDATGDDGDDGDAGGDDATGDDGDDGDDGGAGGDDATEDEGTDDDGDGAGDATEDEGTDDGDADGDDATEEEHTDDGTDSDDGDAEDGASSDREADAREDDEDETG
jgi:penicillin-binding protein 1A